MSAVTNNPERNRFELTLENRTSIAEYILSDGVLIVTHVVVPEELRGRGLAHQLAAAVIAHARENQLKIRPLCSFMATYMKRHPETADLLENR